MLTLIFFLLLIPTLTVVTTLGVWYWFNRESEKALQMKGILIEIGNDTSKLIKDIKGLSDLVSEVAQPLLRPSAIDIESEDVKDDTNVEGNKKKDVQAAVKEKIQELEISERSEKELEIKNGESAKKTANDAMVLEVVDEVLEEAEDKDVQTIENNRRDEFAEEPRDEVEIFTELIQEEENLLRLEEAMQEWKAKGNERLALACAVAIEELKVKQNSKKELLSLWSEEDIQRDEDIAS